MVPGGITPRLSNSRMEDEVQDSDRRETLPPAHLAVRSATYRHFPVGQKHRNPGWLAAGLIVRRNYGVTLAVRIADLLLAGLEILSVIRMICDDRFAARQHTNLLHCQA